jgi:hypothetical protein
MSAITMIENDVIEAQDAASHPVPATAQTQALSVPDNSPAGMMMSLLGRGATLDQIEKMMGLQERYEANEARKAYTDDMARAKQSPPTISKDKFVSFQTQKGVTEYTHATLGNVVRNIVAWLADHRFSHAWRTEHLEGGRIAVTCTLTHAMGHSESVSMEASKDDSGGKNNIQAVGSAITYLQRYTLLAITGLATEDQDDDGAGAEPQEAEDETLIQFRNAAMLGEKALRSMYDRNVPTEEFWKKHGRSLKDAAKKADQERAQ